MRKRTPEDYSVEIGFLEGLRRQMPDNVDLLRALADDYTRAGRHQDGLDTDLELVKRCPEDSYVHYNLACSYALLLRLAEAADALLRAVELGYGDVGYMMRDPDLESLRQSPDFEKVRRKILGMGKTES